MKKTLLFSILLLTTHFSFCQWTQLGIDIDGENLGDNSGRSVSLSNNGTIVAIGANGNDGNGNSSGHVRVYELQGGNWAQLGSDIDGESANDYSGWSVSLNGDGSTVAIGAIRNSDVLEYSGHVRIYEFNGGDWIQKGGDIDGVGFYDEFGYAVSLSDDGNIVAIGSGDNGGVAATDYVQIYEFDGANWIQLGTNINGEAPENSFGSSVSLSNDGSRVAIGDSNNHGNGGSSGHVRVYEFDGVDWIQLGMDIDGEAAGDGSGGSVSLNNNGTIVAIGATGNDDNGENSGHARIYEYNGVDWIQLGMDIDGEAVADFSGYSVSLSADGNIVAIGSNGNDGNGMGSGHVRVYEFDGINWIQVAMDIDGEAANDEFGRSVSISSDGSRVAIGALFNDGNGINSGHVRIYTSSLQPYTQIPDDNFEATLDALGYDDIPGDNQVPTANIVGITSLDVSNQNIADLTGIEDFIALETLYCYNNLLTTLNVTQNLNLIELRCYNNQLAALDVTQNSNLVLLWCLNNQLTDLDVTQNTNLNNLRCYQNPLTNLDVTQNPNLIVLDCHDNQLATLDLTQNPNLIYLWCNNNQLATLDVSQNTNLTTLYCYNNQLANLDITQNINLSYLVCSQNQLTALDLTQNTQLTNLNCRDNLLSDLDLTQNTNLTNLQCYNNQLTTLDLTQNPNLTLLYCYNNQLTALDVTQNPNLTDLRCSDNQLTTLDTTQNPDLTHIICFNNQLTELDVTQNSNLTALFCYTNQLVNLDVTQNPNLTQLFCYQNQLTALDASQNTNLATLQCYDNQLTTLDLPASSNLTQLLCYINQLTDLDVTQNPNLTTLQGNSNQLTALDITQNPNLTNLQCNQNQLTTLDVTQNLNLTTLQCTDNQLTALDVTQNSNLTELRCYGNSDLPCIEVANEADANAGIGIYTNWVKDGATSYSENCPDYTAIPDANFEAALNALGYDDIPGDNQVPTANIEEITFLDISNQNIVDLTGIEDFLALETLNCNTNLLTTIDVTQNTNLISLDCSNNQIAELNSINNINLTTLLCNNNELIGVIDLSNLNTLTTCNTSGNTNLVCIQVANATDANGGLGIYTTWIKDPQVSYSENCLDSFYTHIPDANFEEALINQGIDTEGLMDSYVLTTDISGITTLNITWLEIVDLTGIEDFTALQELHCYNNQITTLDVTNNLNLTALYCDSNQLSSLDMSNNTNLTTLWCQHNQITNLTINNATNLEELHCSTNQLTELDITNLTNLQTLNCHNNLIDFLDITNLLNLETLNCQTNQLTELNVSNNTNLTTLWTHENPDLSCIQVANATDANGGLGNYSEWIKDPTSIYTEDCNMEINRWIQLGTDMDGEAVANWYGYSLSFSGDGNVVASGTGSGANYVKVFEFNGTNWIQRGNNLQGTGGTGYGSSVSLNNNGTVLAVGAPLDDISEFDSGRVRIYQYDGVDWILTENIFGESSRDRFGSAVSLSSDGNRLAVGAYGNEGNTGNIFDARGHVRVFEFNGANWIQLGGDIDGEASGDRSGIHKTVSLSANGNRVAIGSRENDGNGVDSGHTRIFEYNGVNWIQLGVDIDGEAAHDQSGWSVSLNADGSRVAIGAHENDGNGISSGHTRIFEYNGVNWIQLGADIDGGTEENFGVSVSLNSDGNRVAIGGIDNMGEGTSSGFVRVYEYDGVNWVQLETDINGEAAGDYSGSVVSLSSDGSSVSIGAYLNDGNGVDSGHVQVFGDATINPEPFYTQIPDTNFEQALINQGIDSEGLLNGQVLTADIAVVITLDVSVSGIADLTGIEDFTALQELYCYNNLLTTLDVSNNINLTALYCDSNQLTNLDVSSNVNLTTLWAQYNPLINLTVNGATNLQELQCAGNQLTNINVSGLINLQTLVCHANQLTSLDVSNNPMMTILYVVNNPTLSCIQVANAADADAGVGIYTNWTKDGTANYSEDCSMMARSTNISNTKDNEENTIETALSLVANDVVLYPNPVKDQLYIVLPTEMELLKVTIYNVKGEQVAKAKTTTLSTTHIAAGVYFVKIQLLGGESITKKVIVSRN